MTRFSLQNYFIVSALFLTFFVLTGRTLAEEYIQVNGKVGDVVAGPSSNPVEDDSPEKTKNKKESVAKVPAQPSTVSVEPGSLGGAVFSIVKGIAQFTTPRPAFQGSTNIQNADISLIFTFGNFSLRSVLQADAAGEWLWLSPEDFPNGNFTLTVLAVHPTEPTIRAQAIKPFHVLTNQNTAPWSEQFVESASSALFDLAIRVQDPYKTVVPGNNVVASISLVNFSATGSPIDVVIEYSIQDENGREVLHQKETVAVGTKVSFLKAFYTAPDMKEGTYRIIAKTPSRNTLAVASAEFTLKGEGELLIGSLAKIDYTAILQGMGAIAATFIFISYFELAHFLKVRKRIHSVSSKLLKKFF